VRAVGIEPILLSELDFEFGEGEAESRRNATANSALYSTFGKSTEKSQFLTTDV
jgi:hypothetical protein